MKLSSDEGRALAFVLGLIALAGVARFVTRPEPAALPAAAEVDAGALERESEAALDRQRALARPLGTAERIDVNAAAADELDRLPGIGPALAARIVAERTRGGAFDSAADLRAVPGLGPALLARLAAHLDFGPGTGLARRDHGLAGMQGPGADTRGREDGRRAAWREAGVRSEAVRPPGRRSAAADDGRAAAARAAEAARVSPSRPPAIPPSSVDVNRASPAELERLPGIGPALAARIVAKRDSVKGFRSVEDLLTVRGIGPATLRRLKPYLRM